MADAAGMGAADGQHPVRADGAEEAPARVRLFAAVDIPSDVREAIETAAGPLRRQAPSLRWTAADAWHITVAFLGWTDPGAAPAVEAALERAAAAASPFVLQLTGRAGIFGGSRGRVLWAGLEAAPELAALARGVEEGLRPLGFALEQRAFHAHVTLARAGRRGAVRRGLAEAYAGPSSVWEVRELALMKSHLARGGARYESLAAWPLGAAAEDA